MQTEGRHGPFEGEGKIIALREGRPVSLNYSYNCSYGVFRGSISMWDPDDTDMGLVAYISRELPTREAMVRWIFEKAEKLTNGE